MNNNISFLQFMAKDDSTYSAMFSKDILEKKNHVLDNCIFFDRIVDWYDIEQFPGRAIVYPHD